MEGRQAQGSQSHRVVGIIPVVKLAVHLGSLLSGFALGQPSSRFWSIHKYRHRGSIEFDSLTLRNCFLTKDCWRSSTTFRNCGRWAQIGGRWRAAPASGPAAGLTNLDCTLESQGVPVSSVHAWVPPLRDYVLFCFVFQILLVTLKRSQDWEPLNKDKGIKISASPFQTPCLSSALLCGLTTSAWMPSSTTKQSPNLNQVSLKASASLSLKWG